MNEGTWYRTGLVSLTNGSDLVSGVGTEFIDHVLTGGIFFSPEGQYEVARVVSDTELRLVGVYLGASVAGAEFEIAPTQGAVVAATKQLQAFLVNLGPLKQAWEAGDLNAKGLVLKGVKNTEAELPSSGNAAGDGWLVDETLWVWTGTTWHNSGALVTTPALEQLRTDAEAAADNADLARAAAVATRNDYEDRVYPGVYSTAPNSKPHSGLAPAQGDRCTILLDLGTGLQPVEHMRSGGGWVIPNVNASNLASAAGPGLLGVDQTLNYAAQTLGAVVGMRYSANGFPWLVKANDPTEDQHARIAAAFAFVKSVGGTLEFRPGDYYTSSVDFSGSYARVAWRSNGARFRPFSTAQTQIFYANNGDGTQGSFAGVPVIFYDTQIYCRTFKGAGVPETEGDIDYGVNFISASAKWHDSSFWYGKLACYRGWYHQYGQFWRCLFTCAVTSNDSSGLLLTGAGSYEASNENHLYACQFISNKTGAKVLGGLKNRFYGPTTQDMRAGGKGGIWVSNDATGFGAEGTVIDSLYGEVGAAMPALNVGVAPGTMLSNTQLLDSVKVLTTCCYDLFLINVRTYGTGGVELNHPAPSTDTASVTIIGGNINPNFSGLVHAGTTRVSRNQPGLGLKTDDNIARSIDSKGRDGIDIVGTELLGARARIVRGAATDLFSIEQSTFGTPSYRTWVGELTLTAWDDSAPTSQHGYSARMERRRVFITNNSGVLACFVSAALDATDLGASPTYSAVGPLVISTVLGSNYVQFRVTVNGAGTAATTLSSATVGYELRGMAANPVVFKRSS